VCCPFTPIQSFSTTNRANGTVGRIENGDSFAVAVGPTTMDPSNSTPIDLKTVLGALSGPSVAGFVKLLNNGFGPSQDGLWVCGANSPNCAGGTHADEILGRINLGAGGYATGTVVFNATITWNATTRTFTVMVGSCVSGCDSVATGGSSAATFVPVAGSGSATETGHPHF
jgi:hypothetical protein